ncbi:MAG: hypothetical protein ACK55Z_37790 [bacterium]
MYTKRPSGNSSDSSSTKALISAPASLSAPSPPPSESSVGVMYG